MAGTRSRLTWLWLSLASVVAALVLYVGSYVVVTWGKLMPHHAADPRIILDDSWYAKVYAPIHRARAGMPDNAQASRWGWRTTVRARRDIGEVNWHSTPKLLIDGAHWVGWGEDQVAKAICALPPGTAVELLLVSKLGFYRDQPYLVDWITDFRVVTP